MAKHLLLNPNLLVKKKDQNLLSRPFCNYCKKIGHIISECLYLKRKKEKQEGLKPTGLTPLRSNTQSCVKEEDPNGLRLILLWRFMNHSYQMVLCH